MSTEQPKVLVTGASGKLGTLVLTSLVEAHNYPVSRIIATSRNPDGLEQWSKLGIEVRKSDFNDPTSLVESFQGADKVLLISTDSLDNNVRMPQHRNAVAAAKEAGVGHLVYTSLPKAESSLVSFSSVHYGTEEAIQASGLTWTILRNNWYFENLLMTIPGALASGTLYTAAGEGKIAYIARADIAAATAASLTAISGVVGKTFTLTGSEALDIDTVAGAISRIVERPIKVAHVPEAAIIEGAKAHGIPEPIAIVLASFDTASKAGDLSDITSDFETLTGKSPQLFADWLEQNKQLFG